MLKIASRDQDRLPPRPKTDRNCLLLRWPYSFVIGRASPLRGDDSLGPISS